MSNRDSINSSESDNLCVVCFKNVEIFSIGACDHAVCSECSTRMRILCKQNECPICRQDLPKVIFTKKIEPFSVLFPKFERTNLQDRKSGTYFCTYEIQKAYYKLLEHRCQICEETERKWPFKTFQQLKDHMRREHELFYCDICSENVKIFSFERRCYTRQELGIHRRKGDPDNTSHRGHPLCEFCDTRFMDNDDLFRHLRRNHLFCHLCDADGKHQYYNSMEDLLRHFREEHYLCEEGDCKNMPLTAVFRTEIDLKGHITSEHLKYMSKSATKQARTLELEFTLAPRNRTENMRNKRYNDRKDNRFERFEEDNAVGYNIEPGGPGGGNTEPQSRLFVNPLTSQDFPALGNAPASSNITVSRNFSKLSNAPFKGDDFPSLGGPSSRPAQPAVTITTNSSNSRSNRGPEVTITRTPRSQPGLAKNKQNFPALGGGNSSPGSSTVRLSVNSNSQDSKAPKVSIQVNHKPNGAITTHITTSASSSIQRPSEAFPALGKTTPVSQPQWVQAKPKKKEEPKNTKVAPCPQLSPSDLASFPTLSKGKTNEKPTTKSSSVTVPVSSSWVNLNSANSNSKNSNNNASGDSNNKKSEVSKQPPSSKESNKKQSLENKLDEMKLVVCKEPKHTKPNEETETKNKNKKKKNKTKEETARTKEETTGKPVESDKKDYSNPKNGLVKKRSELKIGTLTNSGETSSISSEFPTLGGAKPPPGFTVKPPPGFGNSNFPSLGSSNEPFNNSNFPSLGSSNVPTATKPVFNNSNFPTLGGSSNDLTFTNSSGQSYSIVPSNNYRQPNNFQSRNHNLIQKFMRVLNNNDAINEFKNYSDLFRKGNLPAEKYYEHCRAVLGDSFEEVFPELLVLLPDVGKQQDLYRVHDGASKKSLVVCENCKQVIFKKELTDHYNYHTLDNHFPSLGQAQVNNNVWKKREC